MLKVYDKEIREEVLANGKMFKVNFESKYLYFIIEARRISITNGIKLLK